MQDPIGNFEQIRELFLSYLDTAFRIGNERIAEERRQLLRKPGQLATDPLVEPLPRYQPLEKSDGQPFQFEDALAAAHQGFDPLKGLTDKQRQAISDQPARPAALGSRR